VEKGLIKVEHSHFYRNSKPFEKQKVLIIGAGFSAFDIGSELRENGIHADLAFSGKNPSFSIDFRA
jgi:cation diffusion facilitator CzcD-associated flavoprotein CzcO